MEQVVLAGWQAGKMDDRRSGVGSMARKAWAQGGQATALCRPRRRAHLLAASAPSR